jgi:hypothetical protein
MTVAGLLLCAGGPAYAAAPATTIGPVQISPIGHPHLCWEATGNGAPIGLAPCESGVQNQQWTLNPDGTLLNGIGYCLEALPGQAHGTPLYIDFASQCDGSRGQVWAYTGSTGQLSSTGACAGLTGSAYSGAQIVRAACGHTPRWSLGYSHVTLTPGPAGGPAGGTYSASVTVTDAASAQTAYGVTTTFTRPAGLPATGLHGTGFHCAVATLTCTGTLPAGTSTRITLTGTVPAGAAAGAAYSLSARVAVHGTAQQPGLAHTTAALQVAIGAAAAAPAAGGVVLPLSMPLLALIVGLFLLAGALLVVLARRRRPTRSRSSAHSHAPPRPHAPGRPHAPSRSHRPAHSHAYPDPQTIPDLRANVPVQADPRTHPGAGVYPEAGPYPDARPHAYEGRRRRTGPEPVAEPGPLVRPGRHHAHR